LVNYSPGRRSFSEFEDAVILNELLRNARDKAQRQAENPTAVNRVVAETLTLKRQKPIDRGVDLTHGLGKRHTLQIHEEVSRS